MCLAFWLFNMMHRDITASAMHILHIVRISPENHYVELGLVKLGLISPTTIRHLGIISVIVAAVLLVEGTGLWFGAAWAEYFVVISTGLFIPGELLIVLQHVTWVRLTVLVINTAIFLYLANVLWEQWKERRKSNPAA